MALVYDYAIRVCKFYIISPVDGCPYMDALMVNETSREIRLSKLRWT